MKGATGRPRRLSLISSANVNNTAGSESRESHTGGSEDMKPSSECSQPSIGYI